jgi:hypothetical protein
VEAAVVTVSFVGTDERIQEAGAEEEGDPSGAAILFDRPENRGALSPLDVKYIQVRSRIL